MEIPGSMNHTLRLVRVHTFYIKIGVVGVDNRKSVKVRVHSAILLCCIKK